MVGFELEAASDVIDFNPEIILLDDAEWKDPDPTQIERPKFVDEHVEFLRFDSMLGADPENADVHALWHTLNLGESRGNVAYILIVYFVSGESLGHGFRQFFGIFFHDFPLRNLV